MAALRILKWKS